jgi:hypothetical protein
MTDEKADERMNRLSRYCENIKWFAFFLLQHIFHLLQEVFDRC